MHKWNPADYRNSSSAQYNWAMALIADLKLKGDECILDIGCGDGRITAHLERYPLDEKGQAHVQMMRLEVEAERPV